MVFMDNLRDFFKKGDVLLLTLCVCANLFGIALVYSATRYDPALHTYPIKQAIFLCLAWAASTPSLAGICRSSAFRSPL